MVLAKKRVLSKYFFDQRQFSTDYRRPSKEFDYIQYYWALPASCWADRNQIYFLSKDFESYSKYLHLSMLGRLKTITLVSNCKRVTFWQIEYHVVIQVPNKLAIFNRLFWNSWCFMMATTAELRLLLVHLRWWIHFMGGHRLLFYHFYEINALLKWGYISNTKVLAHQRILLQASSVTNFIG